jgi:hypothetical protein
MMSVCNALPDMRDSSWNCSWPACDSVGTTAHARGADVYGKQQLVVSGYITSLSSASQRWSNACTKHTHSNRSADLT